MTEPEALVQNLFPSDGEHQMTKGNHSSTPNKPSEPRRRGVRWLRVTGLILVIGLVVVLIAGIHEWMQPDSANGTGARRVTFYNQSQFEASRHRAPHINVWWDDVPLHRQVSASKSGQVSSNVHPGDYAGPDSCRECHRKNYDDWSVHPHRWMNALADSSTVVGDFSGTSISYLGGKVTFFRENDAYRMRLERETSRTYAISQTIGSRFFQYYVGRQIDGPEPADQASDPERFDHVLPLGYWIEPGEWVPIVNVAEEESPDGRRMDPFDVASYQTNFCRYADSCDQCHTTIPLGDLFSGNANQMAREVPRDIEWAVADYLEEERPEWLPSRHRSLPDAKAAELLNSIDAIPASDHAVTLGISCESCHLGCREHTKNPKILPAFFPRSPHLHSGSDDRPVNSGRTHDNMNWACGRCHSGDRPQFAAGMSTWNSTEYSDAMRGSCYSQLKCIDCHNPHQAIGHEWPSTPENDDARCIKCHQQFASPESQSAHSHHEAGSEGSRCMNCHMPRINEGLQDMVRTHTIFSPTNADMIHANHPNACNQCHTDKSIDWTIDYLKKWYGSKFDETKLQLLYPNRSESAALGWLQSDNEAVRKVAADSLFRTRSRWDQNPTAREALIRTLDDPYLINRQFARQGIESMLGIRLKDCGYLFYMTPKEREAPMSRLREAIQAGFEETAAKSEE